MADNGYIQVPPDSSGKKIATMEHVIDGQTVEMQEVHVASGDAPDRVLRVDSRGAAYTRYSEGQPIMDSLNRLKVVTSHIIGVYEHTNTDYADLFFVDLANNGSATHVLEEASVILAVNSVASSKAIRTTNRYHYFQPGCPVTCSFTAACGDAGKIGNQRAWGLYDDEDGVFFRLNEETFEVVLRSSVGGDELAIAQANWNMDKLDGTGPSGTIFDVTKAYIYWLDIGWDAGTVRLGVYGPDGDRIVCHVFRNAGANSYAFMQRSSLPVRFENINTGTTSGNSSLREGTAIVKAEGELDYTFWRFNDLGCDAKSVSDTTPLFGVRARVYLPGTSRYNHVNVFPECLSVFTDQPIKIQVVADPEITGANWVSGDDLLEGDSASTQANIGENSWSWHVEFCGIGAVNIDLTRIFELNDEGIQLGADNATQSSLYFIASTLSGQPATVTAKLSYRELY